MESQQFGNGNGHSNRSLFTWFQNVRWRTNEILKWKKINYISFVDSNLIQWQIITKNCEKEEIKKKKRDEKYIVCKILHF